MPHPAPTLLSLSTLIAALRESARSRESQDAFERRHDPSPQIATYLEAAHIIENLPLTALAALPPFINPTPPTFP